MGKSNTFENEFLALIFQNANIGRIGDTIGVRGSVSAGSIYIALHTADPGEDGDQLTNEANYTSYARVAVVRSESGWIVSGNSVVNADVIAFPVCTGGSNTITHFSIGTDPSGTGKILFKGALTDSLSVSNGITPTFAAGALEVTEE